ncbi:MAG: divergent polysaccharide deacetylase family protein [Treponema sp.]|nr:divergent polysaccharide deacetylase family protein [Treponema sp.]MBR6913159.1 divergent polysaccharide deacetylase family protein [Treponema sp.]
MTEKNKLYILSGAIVFVCLAILGLNFFLNYIDKHPGSKSDEIEETMQNPVSDDDSKNFDVNPFENLSQIDKFNDENKENKENKTEPDIASSEKNDGAKKIDSSVAKKDDAKNAKKDEPFIDSAAKKVRMSDFKIPMAKNDATLYFVFDDAGHNVENLKRYMELPFVFSVSILPGLPHSAECAELVRKNNRELMLHQPMQAENLEISPGPKAITAMMGTKEIAQLVISNIDSLGGGVKGVNNHEGSLITSNIIKIGAVLEVCRSKKIYFLDSKTTVRSKAYQAGLELDMNVLMRSAPFLDNEVNRASILSRIYESLDYANTHEKAIIIGHVDKSVDILPDLLSEMYPALLLAGYKFDVPSNIKSEM